MKKLVAVLVVMLISSAAMADQYAAHGFRITQVGTGTAINVTPIHQDGFNNEQLCNEFILDQKALAAQIKTPSGLTTNSLVEATCSTVKQAAN